MKDKIKPPDSTPKQDNSLLALRVLWLNHYYGDDKGLTTAALAEQLDVSIVTISGILKSLNTQKLVVQRGTAFTGARPARLFRIQWETLVTWPASAAMILHLFECEGDICSRQNLVDHAVSMGFIDKATKKPYSRKELEGCFEFSLKKKYIAPVLAHPRKFFPTKRARDKERQYLEMIVEAYKNCEDERAKASSSSSPS